MTELKETVENKRKTQTDGNIQLLTCIQKNQTRHIHY